MESMIPDGSRCPELRELLALHLTAGVGAVTYRRLLRTFGSVQGVLAAPAERIRRVEGVGPRRARSLSSGEGLELAGQELERAAELGVSIIGYCDPGYPPALKHIFDPPLLIYVKGELKSEDALGIGVVGARNASHYGRLQAGRFSAELAGMGFTVISGLARGVDSVAHSSALEAGGRTLAVMGRGLAGIYPPDNEKLAGQICEQGALISELPLDAPPSRENFPRRNRLISGLSLGVLIVEGSRRSGSLITARCALEQGREVFAVPGRVDNPLARGPNDLIRSAGAKLVEDAVDILDELGPVADDLVGLHTDRLRSRGSGTDSSDGIDEAGEAGEETGDFRALGLTGRERAVLDKLGRDPLQVDELVEICNLPPAEMASILMILEVRRLARRLPGQRYIRVAG